MTGINILSFKEENIMTDSLTAYQPITDISVLICLPKGKFAIQNCIVYLGRRMWTWKVHDKNIDV